MKENAGGFEKRARAGDGDGDFWGCVGGDEDEGGFEGVAVAWGGHLLMMEVSRGFEGVGMDEGFSHVVRQIIRYSDNHWGIS